MTVQTRKSTLTRPYELQGLDKRGRVLRYIDWQLFLRSKPDFVSDFVNASKVGTRFNFLELKESLDKVAAGQISAYLKMPSIARNRFFVITDTIKVTKTIKVDYVNHDAAETLLGNQGKIILEKVLHLIKNLATELDWPLVKIDIRYTRDFEVQDWEYVVLNLVFNCKFETADEYLEEIYSHLDGLIQELSSHERELIANFIYLDIETTKYVPSS